MLVKQDKLLSPSRNISLGPPRGHRGSDRGHTSVSVDEAAYLAYSRVEPEDRRCQYRWSPRGDARRYRREPQVRSPVNVTEWLVVHPVQDPTDRIELAKATIYGPFFYEEDARRTAQGLGDSALVLKFAPPPDWAKAATRTPR